MAVKHYGIYLAYPPTVDLRAEGLGRHLAAFLKGAAARPDIRFVVVCPSWSRQSIIDLCQSEGVVEAGFDLITPAGFLISLKIYGAYKRYISNIKSKMQSLRQARLNIKPLLSWIQVKQKIASARNACDLLLVMPMLIVFSVLQLIVTLCHLIKNSILKLAKYFITRLYVVSMKMFNVLHVMLANPKNNSEVFTLFQYIEKKEIDLMLKMIGNMNHVKAWFTPTAFWPSFNQIIAPKLMCVPDVVLSEFPVGFSVLGSDRVLETFHTLERTIKGCDHFVTYSSHIKQTVLVERYGIQSHDVHVVHHAPNNLSPWPQVTEYSSKYMQLDANGLCDKWFMSALRKSSHRAYTDHFENTSVKFIFYASQFRPSKNVITLLRAYNYLLRKRFIGHKLILTGRPGVLVEIDAYLIEHGLQQDVLLLSSLTIQELTACYQRADLAVNPSLSEGGCPFTFTEALSVGTPVVMANIPVTREIIQDADLQNIMLFDPYDWRDVAARIEWALLNKQQLLDAQIKVYTELSQRTWCDVVNEYIDILDKLCEPVHNTPSRVQHDETACCV